MPAIVSTLTGSRSYPRGVAVDSNYNVFVADSDNNRVLMITPEGQTTPIGTDTTFSYPRAVATDSDNNVYVADSGNKRVCKIAADGTTSEMPGPKSYYPCSIAVDSDGTVYVADTNNHRIVKILSSGIFTTLAGGGAGSFKKNGRKLAPTFNQPRGVAVDDNHNVYVADTNNNRICKLNHKGIMNVVAGSGASSFGDGHATNATFNQPTDVAVDAAGSIYVADTNNNRIRKISADGEVITLAGSGSTSFGDGVGKSAHFHHPHGITVDDDFTVYIADYSNNNIRKLVDPNVAPSATRGTFAQRMKLCRRWISRAHDELNVKAVYHAPIVADAESAVEAAEAALRSAQAGLIRAKAAEAESLAPYQGTVSDAENKLRNVEHEMKLFQQRVAEGSLDDLTVEQTYELLFLLGIDDIKLSLLRQEGVTGSVLVDLGEKDMKKAFKIKRLGDRRRLTLAIRRLASNGGFAPPRESRPGALGWSCENVCDWLHDEGLGELVPGIADHDIDGVCLLNLNPDDLGVLGVGKMSQKSSLQRKLDHLRRLSYAGHPSYDDVSVDVSHITKAASPQAEEVLKAVMADNAQLRARVDQAPSSQSLPDAVKCRILPCIMEDPVIAMDGHTYDREAIETWFQRSDRSPMTNLPIPPILIPNIGIKQMIESLNIPSSPPVQFLPPSADEIIDKVNLQVPTHSKSTSVEKRRSKSLSKYNRQSPFKNQSPTHESSTDEAPMSELKTALLSARLSPVPKWTSPSVDISPTHQSPTHQQSLDLQTDQLAAKLSARLSPKPKRKSPSKDQSPADQSPPLPMDLKSALQSARLSPTPKPQPSAAQSPTHQSPLPMDLKSALQSARLSPTPKPQPSAAQSSTHQSPLPMDLKSALQSARLSPTPKPKPSAVQSSTHQSPMDELKMALKSPRLSPTHKSPKDNSAKSELKTVLTTALTQLKPRSKSLSVHNRKPKSSPTLPVSRPQSQTPEPVPTFKAPPPPTTQKPKSPSPTKTTRAQSPLVPSPVDKRRSKSMSAQRRKSSSSQILPSRPAPSPPIIVDKKIPPVVLPKPTSPKSPSIEYVSPPTPPESNPDISIEDDDEFPLPPPPIIPKLRLGNSIDDLPAPVV